MPDGEFIWLCGVVVFYLFYCHLNIVVVRVMSVVCSLSMFLSMCLFVLCVLYLTVLVNYLLHAFAICGGEVSVFSLKGMVLFLCCVGVLLPSPCIVFQRVCVFCL